MVSLYTMEKENSGSLLVCVSPAPSSRRVLEAGARLAEISGSSWTVLTVEPYSASLYNTPAGESLRKHLQYAETLGAQVVRVDGENIADEIIYFALSRGIHRIVIGRTPIASFSLKRIFRKDILDTLLNASPGFEIHVIPGLEKYRKEKYASKTVYNLKLKGVSFLSILIALGILTAAIGIGVLFYGLGVTDTNIVLIFFIAVLFISIFSGRTLGLLSSVTSVLLFNFLFTQPRFTFAVYDSSYLVTFPIMLVVALTASELAVRIKREATYARVRERRTQMLYQISRDLLKSIGRGPILNRAINFLEGILKKKTDCFVPDEKGVLQPFSIGNRESSEIEKESEPSSIPLGKEDMELVREVFESGIPREKREEGTLEVVEVLYPLISRDMVFGVLKVQGPLEPDQKSILEATAAQTALALHREYLYKEHEKNQLEIEKERLHSNLLRSVSHDLRTPLSTIAGSGEILLQNHMEFPPAKTKELLTDIVNDANWLNQMVENLLCLTKAESGRSALHKVPEILGELVSEVVDRLSKKVRNHEVRVKFPDDTIMVLVDAGLIKQVLINILDNAVSYTPPGSTIDIRAIQKEDSVFLEISDNGPGIPEETLPLLFQPFFSVSNSVYAKRKGMGLGLAICKTIVEAHNGTISVQNKKPRGTLFTIILPTVKVSLDIEDE